MKASLLLWVPMEILRNNPRKQVSGFTDHTHPLNARLGQASFHLDEWEIAEWKDDGQVTLRIVPTSQA